MSDAARTTRTTSTRSTRTTSTSAGSADRASSRRARGVAGPLLVVAAAACWGTGGLAGSLLAERGLDPVAVGTYRLLVAAAALVALAALQQRLPSLLAAVRRATARRTDLLRLVGVGVGLAVFQACYFLAVAASGVAVATLLTLGSAPVLVTLAARVLLGERAGARLVVALPLAVAGLLLLVGRGAVTGEATGDVAGAGSTAAGAVLALCSAAGYSAVTLLGRSLAGRVAAEHVTTTGFVVAAVVSLPAGLLVGMAVPVTTTSLALVAYLGVVPTALAYALFFRGLASTPSGVASVLTLVEPLTATVLAVAVLGERLGTAQWTGALLLCLTVVLLAAPTRANPRADIRAGRGRPA